MNLMDAPLQIPPGMRSVAVDSRRAGRAASAQDWVAEEVPVALEYNGVSHAVMLATPADLEDFALGFSLTEDIIHSRADVRGIDVVSGPHGLTVQIEVSSAAFAQLKDRRRTLAGRTGCGLCGTESLPHAVRMPARLETDACFSADAVTRAMQSLRARQPLHAATGATHAAAWSQADGQLALVREDVGRHNALDKLVGALLSERQAARDGFFVVTSRASYEMAGKTARAGVALLAAVSGVTGLAIDVAEAAGLGLIGFARRDALSVYTHAERIVWSTDLGQ
jgi:FdhD protein